ncbi:tyrosine-type recombinase/integrase [Pseudovibrio brasiliensis]|uniref:tyrosine-type recombinase/integrase n=1 Tax=Pseudovibrio brasiliensis TaxID=1898042 RepID=UPI0022870BCA|nr:tyrosine-type recombinase/integrase [Pseudovibrio brasiliensis]
MEPGLTLYGLRHTVATILREIGLNDRDLAAALGHETEAMVRLYAKGADLRKNMSDIAVRFEKEITLRGEEFSKRLEQKCQTMPKKCQTLRKQSKCSFYHLIISRR